MTTCVSVATATLVIVDQLHTVEAAGSVAGPGEAFIQIALTVFANESRRAGACVTADAVHALSSIPTARLPGARLGRTVIHIHLTLEPMCSRWAGACEAVYKVDTGSSVEAGLGVAFIHIILTVHPLVPWFTYTLVCALIVLACSSVATRVRLALIDHFFTVAAHVSWLALTLV